MPRRVFYSFHYEADNWRASQIRNIGAVEGNLAATDNDWEAVKKGGAPAIQRWIDDQLKTRSCTVVLIGANTSGRHWIDYEIKKTWQEGMGLFGIHIHRLLDRNGYTAAMGENPFVHYTLDNGRRQLASIVPAYDPPGADSKAVYKYIADGISAWIDKAVAARKSV